MELKVRDILELRNALRGMEGRKESTTDKDGKPTEVMKYFTFDGKTRLALAQNLAAVKAAGAVVDKAMDDLVRQYADGGDKVTPENKVAYLNDLEVLYEESHEVELYPIKVEALKLDTNAIPVPTLAAIGKIIDAE